MPTETENTELRAQRDRMLEKFTVMQADLGGAFYEMAIRDHVRLDVLTRKAAELQRVDAELLALERMLELERRTRPATAQAAVRLRPRRPVLRPMRPFPRPHGGLPMKRYMSTQLQKATVAAASLTGKRFGLFVASSLVATSAIVATALSNPSGVSPLAALVGQSLAADETPTENPPAASPSPAAGPAGPPRGPRAEPLPGRRAARSSGTDLLAGSERPD